MESKKSTPGFKKSQKMPSKTSMKAKSGIQTPTSLLRPPLGKKIPIEKRPSVPFSKSKVKASNLKRAPSLPSKPGFPESKSFAPSAKSSTGRTSPKSPLLAGKSTTALKSKKSTIPLTKSSASPGPRPPSPGKISKKPSASGVIPKKSTPVQPGKRASIVGKAKSTPFGTKTSSTPGRTPSKTKKSTISPLSRKPSAGLPPKKTPSKAEPSMKRKTSPSLTAAKTPLPKKKSSSGLPKKSPSKVREPSPPTPKSFSKKEAKGSKRRSSISHKSGKVLAKQTMSKSRSRSKGDISPRKSVAGSPKKKSSAPSKVSSLSSKSGVPRKSSLDLTGQKLAGQASLSDLRKPLLDRKRVSSKPDLDNEPVKKTGSGLILGKPLAEFDTGKDKSLPTSLGELARGLGTEASETHEFNFTLPKEAISDPKKYKIEMEVTLPENLELEADPEIQGSSLPGPAFSKKSSQNMLADNSLSPTLNSAKKKQSSASQSLQPAYQDLTALPGVYQSKSNFLEKPASDFLPSLTTTLSPSSVEKIDSPVSLVMRASKSRSVVKKPSEPLVPRSDFIQDAFSVHARPEALPLLGVAFKKSSPDRPKLYTPPPLQFKSKGPLKSTEDFVKVKSKAKSTEDFGKVKSKAKSTEDFGKVKSKAKSTEDFGKVKSKAKSTEELVEKSKSRELLDQLKSKTKSKEQLKKIKSKTKSREGLAKMKSETQSTDDLTKEKSKTKSSEDMGAIKSKSKFGEGLTKAKSKTISKEVMTSPLPVAKSLAGISDKAFKDKKASSVDSVKSTREEIPSAAKPSKSMEVLKKATRANIVKICPVHKRSVISLWKKFSADLKMPSIPSKKR